MVCTHPLSAGLTARLGALHPVRVANHPGMRGGCMGLLAELTLPGEGSGPQEGGFPCSGGGIAYLQPRREAPLSAGGSARQLEFPGPPSPHTLVLHCKTHKASGCIATGILTLTLHPSGFTNCT